MKNAKAAGYDSILNEMVINSPTCIQNLLYRFVNVCLSKGLVPESWCLDLISPIRKDGALNDPDNYRRICISSAFLKIICMLLNNRLQTHCMSHNIIDKKQIGLMKNNRTSDHILALKAVVNKYVTIGKNKLYACFIDFKKAFDSVAIKVSSNVQRK